MPHFARLFLFQFLRARIRRRGATLVELAIVLVVVGILMGGTLIPMRALEERRQLREETRRMESVRDAIIGYALRHRTRERTVKFVNWHPPHSVREFRLPAGRPYLPCPDWDGDGIEDRLPEGPDGFIQGMEVKPDLTVTATISSGHPIRDNLSWAVDSLDPNSSNGWYPYGECRVQKGIVPWRTLGIEPSDGWGNRHTYFADPIFSNAIFGFDRQTIADIFDLRIPRAPGFNPSLRQGSRGGRAPEAQNQQCPAVICNGGFAENFDCAFHDVSQGLLRALRRCAWGGNLEDLILKAGAVTKTEISPASSGGKFYPAGGVTDGLPFVLVSHGPNGRFAVNHWATLRRMPVNFGRFAVIGPVCNHSTWGEPLFELPPSYTVPASERALIYEAVNGFRTSSGVQCGDLEGITDNGDRFPFNQSFFVWEPPGTSDKSDFDDLLLWVTRDELSVAIPGRIPPLPRMVVAYFNP